MLCWVIDFCVWWGWGPVMNALDEEVAYGNVTGGWPGPNADNNAALSWQGNLANLFVVVGLSVGLAMIYLYLMDPADMARSDFHRKNPVLTDSKVKKIIAMQKDSSTYSDDEGEVYEEEFLYVNDPV